MKRLSTFVFALLLAGSLSFAQDTGGDKDSGKKVHKAAKKGHKGGKKGKKGSGGSTTTPPPK